MAQRDHSVVGALNTVPSIRSKADAGAKIRSPCNDFALGISGGWARTFDVKEPIHHRKGYTLYKVVSRVYPVGAPEAVTEIIVWKRYSDFKKLHQDISALHKNLHMQGNVPAFPKSQLFGRFDDYVIEVRRKCAKELLDFVALHQQLFTSPSFSKFFEDDSGLVRTVDDRELLKEKPLIPPPLVPLPSEDSGDRTSEDGEDDFVMVPSPEKNIADECLRKSDPVIEVTPTPVITVSTVLPAVTSASPALPPTANSMKKSQSTASFLSGVWRYRQDEDVISVSSDRSDNDASESCGFQERPALSPRSGSSSVLGESFSDRDSKAQQEELTWELQALSDDLVTHRDRRSPPPLLHLPDQRRGHYIFLAAEVVVSAQEAEAQGDFRSAFVKYRAGVGILLEGVQSDDSRTRRDAVRRKTAQYLERAEQLFNAYLSSTEEISWDDGISPNFSPQLLHLQVPLIELSRYKVLGVVGSVLLVLDAKASKTCVIKVLRKSSASGLWTSGNKQTIVPESLPHMVQLYHYHETPSSIFLVLEHAKGGRLWDYLHRYSDMKRKALGIKDAAGHQSFVPNLYAERRGAGAMESQGQASAADRGSYSDLFCADSDLEDVRREEKEEDPLQGASAVGSDSYMTPPVTAVPGRPGHRRSRSADVGAVSPTQCTWIETKHGFDHCDESSEVVRRLNDTETPCISGEDVRLAWTQMIPEALVKQWAAEIVVSVASLHAQGIVCRRILRILLSRDLNPSNILLGSDGEILLSYFSEWSCINRDISPELIGSGYIAPEIVAGVLMDRTWLVNASLQPELKRLSRIGGCDWWSVGALMYELLSGNKLADVHCDLASHQVALKFPSHVSREACGLLSELLRFNPKERLGTGQSGWEEICHHPFFEGVDWSDLLQVPAVDTR